MSPLHMRRGEESLAVLPTTYLVTKRFVAYCAQQTYIMLKAKTPTQNGKKLGHCKKYNYYLITD